MNETRTQRVRIEWHPDNLFAGADDITGIDVPATVNEYEAQLGHRLVNLGYEPTFVRRDNEAATKYQFDDSDTDHDPTPIMDCESRVFDHGSFWRMVQR